jgi:hypothetical protein
MTLALVLALSLSSTPQYDLFTDRGDTFVRAGSRKGLKVGAELTLLGEKIGDTDERRVVGTANVMEVWDTIARVNIDDATKKASPRAAQLADASPARAKVEAPAPQEKTGCTDFKADAEMISYAFSIRDDRFSAKCCGLNVDVLAHGTMMGAALKLVVNGETVEAQEPFSGNTVTLKGHGAVATIKVGGFGGDYSLKVNGKPCQLIKQ